MEIIRKQAFNLDEFKRIITNFRKDSKSRYSLEYFKGKASKLRSKWAICEEAHWETTEANRGNDESAKQYLEEYCEAEQLFEEYDIYFTQSIEEYQKEKPVPEKPTEGDVEAKKDDEESDTVGDRTTEIGIVDAQVGKANGEDMVRLERVKIPKFDGNFSSWMTFRDVFTAMVHENRHLMATQKMQYLKNAVTGSAAQVISHLTITAANYSEAWNLLNKRFQNKGAIAHAMVQQFCNIEQCSSKSSEGVKAMLDATNGFLTSLKNLQVDPLNILVIHMLELKLDVQSKFEWHKQIAGKNDIPNVAEFIEFLYTRITLLDALQPQAKAQSKTTALNAMVQPACIICKEYHKLTDCKKFRSLPMESRKKIIKENRACFNCLKQGHGIKQCNSSYRCKICNRKHHSFLHETAKDPSASHDYNIAVNHAIGDFTNVLLATASVKVKNINGNLITLRALVDQGAQRSMITENAAQKLSLTRLKCKYTVYGLGNAITNSSGMVSLEIKEKWSEHYLNIPAIIIKGQITKAVPTQTFNIKASLKLDPRELADEQFNVSKGIDILIGADMYGSILLPALIAGQPTYQKTRFGWILSGPIKSNQQQSQTSHIGLVSTAELDKMLTRFWEQEEIPDGRILTPEEEQAEDHYSRYTSRNEYGQYIVRLPFKENPAKYLANNKKQAIIQYTAMEKRLLANEKLYEAYNKCLQEYLVLNQMEEIVVEDNQPCYYMPHHAVVKESSTTTKVRVVFNASSKTASGHALNDILMVGPTIQDKLTDILLRWRFYPIALAADIEKMYRQIAVHPKDTNYQRIVWRPKKDDIIRHYRMNTVTFGTASAPFQATRTLRQLAQDETPRYPREAELLEKDFYMDDFISGADTEEEAIELKNQLTELLAMGNSKLRKWNSNSMTVLQQIKPTERNDPDLVSIQIAKTLGLYWAPLKDVFNFAISSDISFNDPVTKRHIVSHVAKLFDPLGWLQPVVITGKILIQKLWLIKSGWDDSLPPELEHEWFSYVQNLQALQNINIPRWLGCSLSCAIELHGFCDASQLAMAAAVYVRSQHNPKEPPIVRLLIAKTKVAPVQTQSIPRLELGSAVLLIQLMNQTKQALRSGSIITSHYWTDSTDVLAWNSKHPSNWETYVANRISKIQASSIAEQWHHINSEDNPADCATRGLTTTQLYSHDIWWNGAKRIRENVINFNMPQHVLKGYETSTSMVCQAGSLVADLLDQTDVEMQAVDMSTSKGERENSSIFEKFSSLPRLLRVIARCRRFRYKQPEPYVTINEIRTAKAICILWSQKKYFEEEIKCLSKHTPLPRKSRLAQLNPYLDSEGILRVGGRLQKSQLKEPSKHPAIIHPKCHLAKLIVRNVHAMTLHGGLQLTMATVRLEFWILNMQNLVKATIHQCITCFKANAQTKTQLMGTLPSSRVLPCYPFHNTGLDFAGPIKIKWSSHRGAKTIKAYLAIFVCLTTKAMHLELVSDLTTKAGIAAIKRFVSRRGKCKNLYTDNATNFVGASRELRENYEQMVYETQAKIFDEQITWHFIPPGSPHFGGLWEAGVKSVKRHLIKVIGEHILNAEEMYTVLAQIEACLNSRPLTPVSNDPNDFEALTPAHFLIGRPMFALPEPEPTNLSLHQKWELVQKLSRDFWKRWQSEYLQRLQERPKWLRPQANLKIGQLVLVKNENLASTKWPLARILDVHPGADQLVRVVTLRLNGTITRRPVTKLCLLPIPEAEETNNQYPVQTRELQDRNDIIAMDIDSEITPNGALPLEETFAQPNTIRNASSRGKSRALLSPLAMVLCVLVCCFSSTIAHITTVNVSNGIYIEEIGHAQIQHGTLRIDLQLLWSEISQDEKRLKFASTEMARMCEYQTEAASEVHCEVLQGKLVEAISQVQHNIQTLKYMNERSKRGLLGTFLTSIFGVNDEAYKDIENLSDNQKQLISTTQQQGKLLLKALHTMNNTNQKIEQQFSKFAEQVKGRLAEIKNINNRVIAIDHNYVKIQILSNYEIAKGLVETAQWKYQTILNAIYTRTGILDCLRPSEFIQLINKTEKVLPSKLQVSRLPINRLDIEHTDEYLALHGYLLIIDETKFKLIKATAVPARLKDNLFSAKELRATILAIDLIQQKYHEITETELTNAVRINENNYIIHSSIIYEFNNNPNCILKEIYHLYFGDKCTYQTFRSLTTTWKQLYDHNTWLVVTSKPVVAYSICETQREEVVFNETVILKIPRACSLHTPDFTLMPDLHRYGTALKTWFQTSETLNFSLATRPTKIEELNTSMLWSTETYSDYIKEAEELNDGFETINWKNIVQHQSLSITGILLILVAVFITIKVCRRYRTTRPEGPVIHWRAARTPSIPAE